MRSRRNKLGMAVCLLVFTVLAVSTQIGMGCSYNDQGFVLANGNLFVLELLGSPRSEGYGSDLIWLGIRFWRPKLVSGFPSLASSGFVIPWLLFVLVFGGSLRILWRHPKNNREKCIQCQECSYNLTGNVSGVCPECGTEIDQQPADQNSGRSAVP